MKITDEQLHLIDQTLTWLGVAGWVVLLGLFALRLGVRKLWADPLRDTPLLAERLSPWSVLVSLGFYLCVSMLALSWAGQYLPSASQPAMAAASASAPSSESYSVSPDPISRTAADAGAKLITCLVMLLLLAKDSSTGLAGAGLGVRKTGRNLLLAAGGYLLIYPVCNGSAELVDYLLKLFSPDWVLPTHSILEILHNPNAAGWVTGLAVISAVALSPLAEELFFRGLLQNVLVGALGSRWAGVGIAGVLFGAVHMGVTPQYALALALLGVWLGFLYQRFGSLWVCILLHVIFNGVTVTLSLMGEAT